MLLGWLFVPVYIAAGVSIIYCVPGLEDFLHKTTAKAMRL